jgi:hypothetical protein
MSGLFGMVVCRLRVCSLVLLWLLVSLDCVDL